MGTPIGDKDNAWLRRFVINLLTPQNMPNALVGQLSKETLKQAVKDIADNSLLGRKIRWSEGASPPENPQEGDLWRTHFQSGTSQVFIYDPSEDATYPWSFIGGAAMYHGVSADESTASSTFTNLATDGPTLTVPRAGVMDIDFSANGYLPSGGTPPNALVTSISIGGGVPTDVDGIHWGWTVVNLAQHGARELRKTVAANNVVKMQYRSANASTGQFRYRELRVIPVRIA